MKMLDKLYRFFLESYNDMKSIEAFINQHKIFFFSGKYYTTIDKKKFTYIKNKGNLDFIKKNSIHLSRNTITRKQSSKNKLTYLLKKLIYKPIHVKTGGNETFRGELIMFTRENNIKIFDFKGKKILSFINDKTDYYNKKRIYQLFCKFFDVPILDYLDSELVFIEQYLDFLPYPLWSEKNIDDALECIFCNYSKYSNHSNEIKKEVTTTKQVVKAIKDSLKVDSELKEEIISIIPKKNYNDHWPKILTHGDLNFNNILLADGTYFIIDWEDSSTYIFFHDIMNLIFVEAMYSNDYKYICNYLQGTYDEYFSKLFSLNNVQYHKEKRLYYIGVYLAERIINFEFRFNKNFSSVYEKYLVTINEIKNICVKLNSSRQ